MMFAAESAAQTAAESANTDQRVAANQAGSTAGFHRLPGEARGDELIAQIVRVDHAGEYGAQRIYVGQLAVLGGTRFRPVLEHMKEQEQAHLDYFEAQIPARRVRPTALLPLWHVAGFALGAGTALLGPKAAMACTVAVEEAITEHYQEQLNAIGPDAEPQLRGAIERFQAEEEEHRDIGYEHEAEQAPGYRLLSRVIKAGSRAAIWASTRI